MLTRWLNTAWSALAIVTLLVFVFPVPLQCTALLLLGVGHGYLAAKRF